jgi:hypothetical protein
MNRTKQSLGQVGAEFLRIGIRRGHSVGYLARSVASVVSGNWASELRLGEREAMSSMVQAARTLINRSRDGRSWELLVPTVCRLTRIAVKKVRSLLSGEVSWGDGPQFSPHLVRKSWRPKEEVAPPGEEEERKVGTYPDHATSDYLTVAVSPVELEAMKLLRTGVRSAMLRSSYGKAAARPAHLVSGIQTGPMIVGQLRGVVWAEDLLRQRVVPGVLTKHPILNLLRGRLSSAELRTLVEMDGEGDAAAHDIAKVAWGETAIGKNIIGVLSYSDAAGLSQKTQMGVIDTKTPSYI